VLRSNTSGLSRTIYSTYHSSPRSAAVASSDGGVVRARLQSWLQRVKSQVRGKQRSSTQLHAQRLCVCVCFQLCCFHEVFFIEKNVFSKCSARRRHLVHWLPTASDSPPTMLAARSPHRIAHTHRLTDSGVALSGWNTTPHPLCSVLRVQMGPTHSTSRCARAISRA
jgi:hypothetical protein